MSPSIDLSTNTFKRLQGHAEPLVDTIETVITRLLDRFESAGGEAEVGAIRQFKPNSPPDLTHAKILGVSYNNVKLGRGEDNWNGLLNQAVRDAWVSCKTPKEFKELMIANYDLGQSTQKGFKPVEGTEISLQGQDANGAWRAVAHIAQALGRTVSVRFAWREKSGAAHPGEMGELSVR